MNRRRPLLHVAIAGLLAGVACDGRAPPAATPATTDDGDADQDGVTAAAGDCDDFNNTIHPGATDIPGDGIDQDCDGADALATDDADGDGFAASDGDCDDTNSAVHPGARERSFDGVDADCDGEDLPALGDDRFAEAIGIIDTDEDGAISFDEFSAACAVSAHVLGSDARPGVVQTHSSCSGTGACRGMHMHPWNELFVHDCRGVNYCQGWSCVETAPDQGRTGQEAYESVGCLNCHTGADGAFKVEVPPGQDVDATVSTFFARSDERFRSAIAFGIAGISPDGVAYTNMPSHFEVLSRRELDAVVAYIRTLTLEGENYQYGDTLIPDPVAGEGEGEGEGQ